MTRSKRRSSRTGRRVVPGRLLTDIVRSLPEAAVTIDATTPRQARSRADSRSFTVKTLSPDDFPKFPEVEAEKTVTHPHRAMLAWSYARSRRRSAGTRRGRSSPACSSWSKATTLRMVATDSLPAGGQRGRRSRAAPTEPHRGRRPRQGDRRGPEARRSRRGASPSASRRTRSSSSSGRRVYVSRRIEGTFPNYRQLIPKEQRDGRDRAARGAPRRGQARVAHGAAQRAAAR